MKRSTQIILVALSLSGCLRAESLDLAGLLQKAREHSEALGLAQASLDQVKARRQAAFGDWLPQVALKTTESFADKGNTDFQSPGARVNAREDLLKGLDEPAAVAAADAAEAQAQADIAQAGQDLSKQVGNDYYDVLSLEEQWASEKAVLDSALGAAKDLKSRVALGRNRQAEQSSAEAQVARVQATLADLEGQRAQAREALASLCGVPVDQGLTPLPDLAAAASAPSPSEADLDKLPGLASAREALKVAQAQSLAAKGGFFPSLYAEGNYYAARQNGASGPAWDAVLGLDLPLFRSGATVARLKLAQSQVAAAQLRLDLARREAGREARQAWQGLNQALNKAEANRLALDAAEKSYADQQKDFRNSLVTSLDILTAFQAVESARLDTLKARYDTHRAQLRYRLAIGQTLP